MDPQEAQFLRLLGAQRSAYARTLAHRVEDIERRWRGIEAGRSSDSDAEELLRAAHSLAGSGGTFGFPDVSACAAGLERHLQALADRRPDRQQAACVAAAIDTLRQVVPGLDP